MLQIGEVRWIWPEGDRIRGQRHAVGLGLAADRRRPFVHRSVQSIQQFDRVTARRPRRDAAAIEYDERFRSCACIAQNVRYFQPCFHIHRQAVGGRSAQR